MFCDLSNFLLKSRVAREVCEDYWRNVLDGSMKGSSRHTRKKSELKPVKLERQSAMDGKRTARKKGSIRKLHVQILYIYIGLGAHNTFD